MDIFSLITLWLHVIAAVVWVGGQPDLSDGDRSSL